MLFRGKAERGINILNVNLRKEKDTLTVLNLGSIMQHCHPFNWNKKGENSNKDDKFSQQFLVCMFQNKSIGHIKIQYMFPPKSINFRILTPNEMTCINLVKIQNIDNKCIQQTRTWCEKLEWNSRDHRKIDKFIK